MRSGAMRRLLAVRSAAATLLPAAQSGLPGVRSSAMATLPVLLAVLTEFSLSEFVGGSPLVEGGVNDYAIELVDQTTKYGWGAVITICVVQRPTQAVPDAVFFIRRLGMGPDRMADMTAPLALLPDTLPGFYQFETDLLMEGSWALTLAAKLPGEEVPFRAAWSCRRCRDASGRSRPAPQQTLDLLLRTMS